MSDPRTPTAEPDAQLAGTTQSDHTVTLGGNSTERGPASFAFLSPSDTVGDLGRLGGYRVVKLLGEGGMGFVFRAEDDTLQRPIALKVMRPEVAAKPKARDRFLREGRAAAAIKSDHVTIIHQVGESNGVAFLAMEFLDGNTLDDWLKLREKAVPPAAVMKVAKDVLRGLAAAHEKGLVHRDIKPANLWVEARTGRVKVLDFGLTRAQDGDEGLTAEGMVVGTPAYMAPEQAAGKAVDGRADLFSLGVVLHRMLAGRSPFQRNGVLPTLGAVMYDNPPSATSISGVLSPVLAGMIDRLLAKNPDDRPSSAKAALAELVQTERREREAAASATLPVVIAVGADPWADIDVTQSVSDPSAGTPDVRDSAGELRTAVQPSTMVPKRRPWLLIGASLAFVVAAFVAADIIIKIKNKDGTETEIKVPKDATVTVAKGGKEVAKIGPEAAKGVPVTAKSDRAAALWVLSIGGSVWVNGGNVDIKASDLPRESFQLTGVNLQANTKVSDEGLANLMHCKDLTDLDLSGTQVGDAGMIHFKVCKGLKVLYLHDTQVGDTGLANFKDCKDIGVLFCGPKVSDTGLAYFKDCKNLTRLYLHGTQISDEGVSYLKDWNNLTTVYLGGNLKVSDGSLAHLRDLKKLTQLELAGTKVTAAKFEELKKALPKCNILSDHGTYEPVVEPDRKAAEYVLSIGGKVWVNGEDRDRAITAVSNLPSGNVKVTRISLDYTQVTDAAMAVIAKCSNLVELGLDQTAISDAGIVHLAECKQLNILTLNRTSVTDRGFAAFKGSTEFTILQLNGLSGLTDDGLANFKSCKNLTELTVAGSKVGDKGLENLRGCINLRILQLKSTKVTDAGLVYLKEMKSLGNVDLDDTGITDRGLEVLKDHKELRGLLMSRTRITDAGLEYFKGRNSLSVLHLEGSQITDAGLANFKDLQGLNILKLTDTRVGDDGMNHLKNVKGLQGIYIQKTKVTAAKFEELKKAFPKCKIESDHGTYEPK